ncbi:zinc ribbon domain-containing protein [Bifidobacterium parmae]|uniref:Glycoside hydrolase n=1 Tax=Bifidobacterium parmae TaxID=361854 RepID=A0A2N5IVU8_9BIFI|nr:zinc ribbon domain-containing protein [Bifidobacterium parmae]PLS26080.1 glycoside hydrolase [Bifidobacterium parmae]
MTDDDGKPVRGVNTIREELDKARGENTYKSAFAALGAAIVGTALSYVGYEYANTVYVWLWIGTGAAWLAGIGMLVFGKSMEDDRHRKIAELEAELAAATAARDGDRPRPNGPAAAAPNPAARAVPPAASSPVPLPEPVASPHADAAPAPLPGWTPQAARAKTVPLPPSAPSAPAAATHGPSPTPPAHDCRFCGQCGAKLQRDMTFCTRCGARVA